MKKSNLIWIILGAIVIFIMYRISVAVGRKGDVPREKSKYELTLPAKGADSAGQLLEITTSGYLTWGGDTMIITSIGEGRPIPIHETRTLNIPKYIPDTVPTLDASTTGTSPWIPSQKDTTIPRRSLYSSDGIIYQKKDTTPWWRKYLSN